MSMKTEAKSGIDQKNEWKEEIWQIAFNYLFFMNQVEHKLVNVKQL